MNSTIAVGIKSLDQFAEWRLISLAMAGVDV
jgi:hypothetical protein